MRLRECLLKFDIIQRCLGQCLKSHAAALQLRLRTRIIVRNRLTNLEAGGGSAPGSTRTDSADSVAQAAAAAAAGTGGSDSRADAAAQLPSVRSDSAVQEAARLQQRMHRVIAAVGFRPEQRAAFLQVQGSATPGSMQWFHLPPFGLHVMLCGAVALLP